MKKQLLLIVMMLLPMVVSAEAVEIDGIYYNLITKTIQAEVINKTNGYTGSISIPENVMYNDKDFNVTSIGNYAFVASRITSVTIPNSVTSIGDGAFMNCARLTTITIPNSVTSIGNAAFYGCSSLTSLSIPQYLTSIGHALFEGCSGLISITIPNSVTNIGSYAFNGCSGLTTITIPNRVTSIGSLAFAGCSGLQKVIAPDITAWCSINFDDKWANPLYEARHLYSDEDTEITELIIPNSVTTIGDYAFNGWSSLTSITIPNSVTNIGNGLFSDCSGLTTITIPSSITSIGTAAFSGCSCLTSIIIPNSIMSIGTAAFSGCSCLTSITIGSGIKIIDSSAFASCSELTDVTCYSECVPSTGNDAFKDSYIEYATLHVPSASVNAYKATNPWKDFKEIVAISGETPEIPKCEKPTISYENGQLKFASKTEDVEFVTDITDRDIKKFFDATITLTATYSISVYATKYGYDNSDVATATLCWIDQKPETEGIINDVTQVYGRALLIQSTGGVLTIQGVDDGTKVSAYNVSGVQAGSAIGNNGQAIINTNLQTGSIAIIKIGDKSIKITIK